MARTAEEAILQTVNVGGREFPIGQITIHQLFRLKNTVVSLVLSGRSAHSKRELADNLAAIEAIKTDMPTIKAQLATSLGIDESLVEEALVLKNVSEELQRKINYAENTNGYDGNLGALLEVLESMTEKQITDLAVIMLDRSSHSEVSYKFVEQHFNLDWFTEALAIFLETNNIASIIKNLQRLGTVASMQMPQA